MELRRPILFYEEEEEDEEDGEHSKCGEKPQENTLFHAYHTKKCS